MALNDDYIDRSADALIIKVCFNINPRDGIQGDFLSARWETRKRPSNNGSLEPVSLPLDSWKVDLSDAFGVPYIARDIQKNEWRIENFPLLPVEPKTRFIELWRSLIVSSEDIFNERLSVWIALPKFIVQPFFYCMDGTAHMFVEFGSYARWCLRVDCSILSFDPFGNPFFELIFDLNKLNHSDRTDRELAAEEREVERLSHNKDLAEGAER